MSKKIKIVRVVTIPIVFTHILNLLDHLSSDERFELHIVCTEGDFLRELKERYPGVVFHHIEIPRNISLLKDILALLRLIHLFRKEKFDIVHSHTPKAGVTSAIASYVTGVPIRLHTFTGQVWVTITGFKRQLLISLDRLIGLLNTHIYADSFGQREFLLRNKIGSQNHLSVLHRGSFGGINTERFNSSRLKQEIAKLRTDLFQNFTGKILIYLGRLNPEKGIPELAAAFQELKKRHLLKLLIVGPMDNAGDSNFTDAISNLKKDSDVKFIEFTAQPELFLGVGDIFCFPSYREGFGTVALEAAAMGKPVVASNIYGLSDAVSDGQTGLLFEPRNKDDLIKKLELLLTDDTYSSSLGEQGRLRVVKDFSEEILTKKMINDYLKYSSKDKQ